MSTNHVLRDKDGIYSNTFFVHQSEAKEPGRTKEANKGERNTISKRLASQTAGLLEDLICDTHTPTLYRTIAVKRYKYYIISVGPEH